ncbi:MAG: DUF262 domain-containing protein [Acidimicrobiia bacterium]|nr:DUF262 domain-containing protein [Acidimicrobiia bacterium]
MTQIIKAGEKNLIEVFSDSYLFNIPLYQRPYAWTVEQVDELLDDLLNALEHDPQAPYFLGSIVLIKDEHHPASAVVDGQQRLTTLTMVLCALRDLTIRDKDRTNLDAFVKQEGNELKGTKDQFRLRLRDRDRTFFEEHIQTRGNIDRLKEGWAGQSDIQKRITDNFTRIAETLKPLTDSLRVDLAQFIVRKCFLVVVTATDRDSAYRIFSVMNDRGLDLSPTDILKADTIGNLEESEQLSYGDKWETIEERLNRENFRDLFTHIRMIRLKTKMRQTLQADFLQHILTESTGGDFIDHALVPYAKVYETVLDCSYESTHYAEEVNKLLSYLRRLDNSDWIPPAMAFLHKYSDNYEKVVKFTRDLERLAYALFVSRANVNERIKRYALVLNEVEQGDDLLLPNSPLQLTSKEKHDVRQRLDGEVYTWVAVARRVIMLRLDSLVAEAEAGARYDHRVVTVEHVLPQNPMEDSKWVKLFPDEDERYAWTHRLANLVLLSRRKNASASNWDFEQKKRAYFEHKGVSVFALTTQVLGESEWTPAVLERRQKNLVDLLAKEWRLV